VSFRPRGIFARTILLVGLLLLLSHGAAIVLFLVNFSWPAAERSAAAIADDWSIVQSALDALPPDGQARLVEQATARGVPFVREVDPARLVARRSFFQRLVIRHLRRRLDPSLRVQITDHVPPRLWVPVRAGTQVYWVGFRQRPPARPLRSNFFVQLLVMVTLATAGSWIVARRITRPLASLAAAAGRIGRGDAPPPVAGSDVVEVRAVHHAFDRMARDIREASEERERLLVGVSHDLRTPLARLRLALEMSEGRVDPSLHQGMLSDVEEMDTVMGLFLRYVREGVDEPTSPADVNAIVQSIAGRQAQLGHSLTLRLSDLPPMRVKPSSLKRAIVNLVENALRHGKEPVEVHTGAAGGVVSIAVLDRGPGLDPERAARRHTPFPAMAEGAGHATHGIGLAVVERVARLHGGALSLQPRAGGGLEARIALPDAIAHDRPEAERVE
jgi:two-component system, OmpR family, osmolarity sensor histidine kinase EnvZ